MKENSLKIMLSSVLVLLISAPLAYAEVTNTILDFEQDAPRSSSRAAQMPTLNEASIAEITQLAQGNEACLNTTVRGRGQVNQFRGAFIGLAVSIARSACRDQSDPARRDMITGINSSMDALVHYGLDRESERDAMVNTYGLLLAHAARESTGRFWSGVDVTAAASRNNAEQAEAGLCQASNNINMYFESGREGREAILAQYSNNPEACLLSTFSEGLDVPNLDNLSFVTRNGGEDAHGSVAFQRLMRTCPAAATEFCAIGIRHVRRHFGPLTRREARPMASCTQTFAQVYDLATTQRERICNEDRREQQLANQFGF